MSSVKVLKKKVKSFRSWSQYCLPRETLLSELEELLCICATFPRKYKTRKRLEQFFVSKKFRSIMACCMEFSTFYLLQLQLSHTTNETIFLYLFENVYLSHKIMFHASNRFKRSANIDIKLKFAISPKIMSWEHLLRS